MNNGAERHGMFDGKQYFSSGAKLTPVSFLYLLLYRFALVYLCLSSWLPYPILIIQWHQ